MFKNHRIIFKDRREAGRLLGKALADYTLRDNSIILALPRGGVPIGEEIQKALKIPMDLCLVRKLGAPEQRELAIGAVAMGGIRVLNDAIIALLDVSPEEIEEITKIEEMELIRRNELYRKGQLPPQIKRKIVILVDDGLATGATMRVAIKAIKAMGAKEIIIAIPVAAADSFKEIQAETNKVICLHVAKDFSSVGQWYKEFSQVTDAEVQEILNTNS